MRSRLVIGADDPTAPDVQSLIDRHLALAHDSSPPEHVHALGLKALLEPGISFFTARMDGVAVGMGALKHLDQDHVELKSMHTHSDYRGQGVGRAMLEHLLAEARRRGYKRCSLETGTMEAFAAARRLYESSGFTVCEPFAQYTRNPFSVCMTREL